MKEQSNSHDKGFSSDSQHSQVTPEGIRAQMDRILSSPDFKASQKVKTIFRYLSEETLAGREDQISAQTIANKTHKGTLDPNSRIDPLVRIQLNQLRRALKGYEAGAGTTDKGPRIEVPKGRYKPVFHSKKK